jgi:deoxyribodipyrimidine photolyase-like uncharacterized protein
MVPNVYGMSQFADGGLMARKPYISGSNYLKTVNKIHLISAYYFAFIVEISFMAEL